MRCIKCGKVIEQNQKRSAEDPERHAMCEERKGR